MKKNKKYIYCICSVILSVFTFFSLSEAKVYIDITSPTWSEIPITITSTGSADAKTVEEVVKNDLYLTGIFSDVAPELGGAEMAIDITMEEDGNIKAVAVVRDLLAGGTLMDKKYEASKNSVRALGHSIANDVFMIITGQTGSFRTKFTYIVDAGGEKELHLMDWDGYNSSVIESKGLPLVHSWSEDGNYIYYSAERSRQWRILRLNIKQGVRDQIFSSGGINLVGSAHGGLVAFSSSKDGSPEIYTMRAGGGDVKKITTSIGIDISPAFSPDGSKIAFVSDRGRTPQIYIMDPDGKNLKRLTFEGSYNQSPAWSPDGKWIAFVSRTDGKNQIFVIKSDGTGSRQLTYEGNNENPTFSPNGLFIAFDSDRKKGRGIYVMRINGEGQRKITSDKVRALIPRWSPYLN
ncbi:MAG: PD40 domain-containing protein [Nitrospirae bacterium]|nr:PD40 domain-containing protein [Nitrospirota bacterium]